MSNNWKSRLLTLVLLLTLGTSCWGQDAWEDVTANLMGSVKDYREGPNALMNGIGALGVDPHTGDLYVYLQLNGLYLSRDQAQTFHRIDDGRMTGRMMGGCNIHFDPRRPGRAAFFFIKARGEPGGGALTLDGGTNLQFWDIPEIDGFTSGALDWSAAQPQVILARQHHGRENPLWLSTDAGVSWTNLEVNGWQPGVVSPEVLLTGAGSYREDKEGILRSTDGGKTWMRVHDSRVVTLNPEVHGETLYWVTETGLIRGQDAGETWETLGNDLPKPFAGPFFGNAPEDLLIVTIGGFYFSRDAGETWSPLFPKEPAETQLVNFRGKIGSIQSQSYGWDPKNQYLYATKRNGQLMRRQFNFVQQQQQPETISK
jgi:hypothetical protein